MKNLKQENEILKQENEYQRGAFNVMFRKVLGFVNIYKIITFIPM